MPVAVVLNEKQAKRLRRATGVRPQQKPSRRPKLTLIERAPSGMHFRDMLERVERRERNKLAEVRRARLAAIAVKPVETVALMADDANEKVRRVRVMDAVERAFRREPAHIDENSYRLARCFEADVLALMPPSGGLRLERLREGGRHFRESFRDGFVLMPRAPGMSMRAPQARREDALDNLNRVARALGEGPMYAVLRQWAVESMAPYEIDKRWRKKRGWALALIQCALSRMADAQLYEREKWKVDVLAAARA